ncbi:hypothetical protein LTSEINV_6045 [Salmonella enterica subsp. enterica serovar Inverness str. R8-3668]|uniref:Uncharacterized protein n=2 Tax=Salmonella enterica I TaxID=59201 RepID=G5S0U8_SALET|nr:hypothetical protein LTSEINV_6045 [Salmonella enterica subsp. enterica serovar Inverness str. R8-3668]EHC99574.1 hypothetical protein LTSEURB_4810 [Salmonella enterica subsp. enterica serovar Urbana str. R8-2977]
MMIIVAIFEREKICTDITTRRKHGTSKPEYAAGRQHH